MLADQLGHREFGAGAPLQERQLGLIGVDDRPGLLSNRDPPARAPAAPVIWRCKHMPCWTNVAERAQSRLGFEKVSPEVMLLEKAREM